jgi:hypothetical protein
MLDFVISKLLFTLRLNADFPDPYALFGIREEFMQAFRTTVCRNDGHCEMCGANKDCPYHITFSQALADDKDAVKRHQKPPLPFVFDLPLLPSPPNKGCEIEIGLALAGTSINYVAQYVAAVRTLFSMRSVGRKVSGKIIRVESQGCSDARNCIMKDDGNVSLDNVATISGRDLLEMNTLDPGRIKLTLLTPMRIIREGVPIREFSCSNFLRSLLRRISSLTYYYYSCGHDFDYKRLAAASSMIEVVENNFHWFDQQKSHGTERLSGIVGSGYLEGRLEAEFQIFLLLGEYFHVGKGAAFGLGRYRIEKGPGAQSG